MQLISFAHNGTEKYGVVKGDGIVDVSETLGGSYASLKEVIQADAVLELGDAAEARDATIALADVEFRLPIAPTGKVFCVGRNYASYHKVIEDGHLPEWPSIFSKVEACFAAHRQPIIRPRNCEMLDYECELAVVISKPCRYITEDQAMDYVMGYTILNDGTVREYSNRGTQTVPSKNFYHASSVGPWIVTADEVPDHTNLSIKTLVDGEIRQDGNTKDQIFKLPYMIAYISQITELQAGDIFSTGSPPGSAPDHDPPGFLKPGQEITFQIEGVGEMRHPIEAE